MISSADKEKIFKADLANIARKTKAGKPLTSQERRIVAEAAEAEREPGPGPGRPRAAGNELPIYDSQEQCAAATGIPVTVLKKAKQAGCSAFRSNRVDLGKLLPFLFAGGEGSTDWGSFYDEYRAKREKLKFDKENGDVLEKPIIRSDLQATEAIMFSELDRMFCTELPPVLKGRDEITIRAKCTEVIDNLKTTLREKFATAGTRPTSTPKAETPEPAEPRD